MTRSSWWPIIIIASAVGTGLAMTGSIESPIRPVVAFWFLLTCPGMAFVRLLRLDERLIEFTLGIALSIGIDALVAETMALTRLWSPAWALAILISMSIAGAALQLVAPHAADEL